MRDVFPDEKTDSSHSGEYPGGEAEAARIRDGLEGQQVCPFCGVVGDGAHAICDKCTMENSPIARKATKLRIGPWYVLQHRNPAAPGMKWETLLSFVRKGRVKPQSIVRGPTTHQLWRFAAHVKGLSREFGVCYSCGGSIDSAANLCSHCNRLQDVPANPDTLLEGGEPEPRIPVYKEIQPPPVPAADEPELTIQPDPAIAAGAAEAAAAAAAEAAEAEAVRRKVREQEEAFAREQREAIAREREAVERDKEVAAREKEAAGRDREAVRREQEELARAREAVAREKEAIESERAAVARQREAARRERESAASAAAALASAVSAVSAASIAQSSAPAEVDGSNPPTSSPATAVPVPPAQPPTQAATSHPPIIQPSAPSTAAASIAQPSTATAASPAPAAQPPARPKPAAAADKSVWDIPASGTTRTPPAKNQRPVPSAAPDKAAGAGASAGARPRAQSARDGFLSARDLAAAFRLTHSPSADYDIAAHPTDVERNADSFFPSEKPERGSGLKIVLVIVVLIGATAATFAASKELRDRVMAAWSQLTDSSVRPSALPRPAPTTPKDESSGDHRKPDRSVPSAVPAPISGPSSPATNPAYRPQTRPASLAPPTAAPPVVSAPLPSTQPASEPPATATPPDPAPSPAMLQEAGDLLARAKGLEATDLTQAMAVLEKIEKFPRAAWPRGFEDELKEVRALRNLK